MKTKIIIICLLFLATLPLSAKIELPTILADNMVLQQQSSVKLWGKAHPRKEVKVIPSWNNKAYTVKSDSNGKWLLQVETPVAGGPYEISISDGEETVLKDILIGEVWFCSGQSNMEMPLKGFPGQPVEGGNDMIAKANKSTPIRMYTTKNKFSKTPLEDIEGGWTNHTSEDISNWSATAYFFGKYLHETLEVPIGLVVSAWGGSKIEAWMSEDALTSFGEFDLSHLKGDVKPSTQNHHAPCYLYNAKLHPLINYTIKGFLWYQGESNRDNPELYEKLHPAFVKNIRNKWNIGDFPFYYVQIAPHGYNDPDGFQAAKLREIQFKNMKEIPNSGMVVTMDIGEEKCIHPAKKQEVGNRLAYWALSGTYNRKGFGYAPAEYKSMEIKEGKIILTFNYTSSRCVTPISTNLENFEIAGNDRVFYPAKAYVSSGKVIVSSEKVPEPVAARYGFRNYVKGNLKDDSDLAVSSFRTDSWE
ncbi:sialate O-acetylesterase [Dysgonomonas sp. 520]|uniref:sialate O-acetylesterase n=1 Tax=Dysgonomonas sp. 520 TaxID=2302931 RepID=UPI0013D2E2C2|nr:sialate O-acetylesterase [Dysgonomonas sp. 520]NDW08570.1 sialate O-acetylesterase [Dysgonomonas sp. 520]